VNKNVISLEDEGGFKLQVQHFLNEEIVAYGEYLHIVEDGGASDGADAFVVGDSSVEDSFLPWSCALDDQSGTEAQRLASSQDRTESRQEAGFRRLQLRSRGPSCLPSGIDSASRAQADSGDQTVGFDERGLGYADGAESVEVLKQHGAERRWRLGIVGLDLDPPAQGFFGVFGLVVYVLQVGEERVDCVVIGMKGYLFLIIGDGGRKITLEEVEIAV
jgi:hypothetical protein